MVSPFSHAASVLVIAAILLPGQFVWSPCAVACTLSGATHGGEASSCCDGPVEPMNGCECSPTTPHDRHTPPTVPDVRPTLDDAYLFVGFIDAVHADQVFTLVHDRVTHPPLRSLLNLGCKLTI